MRSLDDVIKAAECCADVTACRKCPYFDKNKKMAGCMDKNFGKNIFIEDALRHLKDYQKYLLTKIT